MTRSLTFWFSDKNFVHTSTCPHLILPDLITLRIFGEEEVPNSTASFILLLLSRPSQTFPSAHFSPVPSIYWSRSLLGCSVVIVYQRFGGPSCLHLQSEVKIEVSCTSETMLSHHNASKRRHNSEDLDLNLHHRKNINYRTFFPLR